MAATSSLADLKARMGQRKADQAAKKAQFIRPFRFPAGKTRVRLLPGWNLEDPNTFWHDFGMHYVKDKDNKLAAVYICADKTYQRDCPVCSAVWEGIRAAKDTGNASMERLLNQAKSTARVLVNGLVRDGEEPNKPQVIELPSGVFDSMVEQITTFADDDVNMLDPKEGHDFFVTKTGSGLDTEYSVAVAPKATEVTYDVAAVTDLTAYCSQESNQGLLKATGAVTAVTGLPAPVALTHSSVKTGTTGAFMTPPSSGGGAASAAGAAGGAALLSEASEPDEELAADLEGELADLEGEIEGELVDDVPFEVEEPETKPAPKAEAKAKPAAKPAEDLSDEITGVPDDLDDILDGLDGI